jgi:hypothetical protein
MHDIRLKRLDFSEHPIFVPAQQGVAIEIMVQRKRGEASFQFQGGESLLADRFSPRTAMNAKKRVLSSLSKRSKLAAECGYTVGFAE